MKEPTHEPQQILWEWCGFYFKRVPYRNSYHYRWFHNDDKNYQGMSYPPIDLNNLFKYAVPIAIDKIMAKEECSSDEAYSMLFKKWLQKLELDIPNYEGTLFWVLWEER